MLDFDDVKNILFEKNIDLEKVYSVLPDNVKPVGNDERNYSRINTLREPMSGIKETYNNALDAMNELPGLSPVIRIVQYNPVFIFSIEDSGRGLTQTEMENNLLSFNSQNQSESRNGVYSQGFKQSLSFSKITYVESIKENVKS
jgi:DNA topoisomerase VI subunit B